MVSGFTAVGMWIVICGAFWIFDGGLPSWPVLILLSVVNGLAASAVLDLLRGRL